MLCRRTIICIAVLALFFSELVSCDLDISSLENTCRSNDPSNCVKEVMNGLRPYLKDGVPALEIPSLDPLPFQDLEYSQTGSVSFHIKCNNVFLNGVSNFELNEVRFDPETNMLQMEFFFPRLDLVGNYKLTGRLFFTSFRGNDRIEGSFRNIRGTVSAKVNAIQDPTRGVVYWRLDDIRVALNIDRTTLHLNNIQPRTISITIDNLLKLLLKTLVPKATPKLEQYVALLIDNMANQALLKLSENKLLSA